MSGHFTSTTPWWDILKALWWIYTSQISWYTWRKYLVPSSLLRGFNTLPMKSYSKSSPNFGHTHSRFSYYTRSHKQSWSCKNICWSPCTTTIWAYKIPRGGREWIHKGCPPWVYPSGSMCYMCDHLLETPSMMILHWLTVQRVVSCNNLKRMVGSFEWPMNYRCYVIGQFFRLYCMQSIEPSIPGNFCSSPKVFECHMHRMF